jgi:hypothetical protein
MKDDEDEPGKLPARGLGSRDIEALPKVAMLFSASTWTFNVRLGRSGREESEGVILMGEISYRSQAAERRLHTARAMVVKSDARKRLDLVLGPQEAVLTIPLEPFAMQRLQDRLKDLVSFYGMTLRVAFTAAETAERQNLDAVDFAFSSLPRPPGARTTQANDR